MKFTDQLGRDVILTSKPSRIVSLVPSQTELLVDLGLESSIVGVTKFCVHPTSLRKQKMVVGGTKTVNYKKIEDLNPDIILCNKEENTQEMIIELEKIAPVHLSDIVTFNDSLKLIEMYGELFTIEDKATECISQIESAHQLFSDWIINKPNLKVAYFIWKDPWMVAANSTFINEILQLNKFDNYFSNLERYPEVRLEDIDDTIDLLLFSSEPFPFKDKHLNDVCQKFPESKIKIVDGEFFSWYGSRMRLAFDYFKKLRASIH